MIGVVARPEEHEAVREFFELFKTPWELCRPDEHYPVVLVADGTAVPPPGDLLLIYGSAPTAFDRAHGGLPGPSRAGALLSRQGERLPIYGSLATLAPDGSRPDLVTETTGEPVARLDRSHSRTVVRVGYDLFREVQYLLTTGQPAEHAAIPTLERHIALLRRWIVDAGIPLVEIPPVPDGHRFIVCLTHDLDHPAVRFHGLDPTTLGFLHRALVGSLVKMGRGRMGLGEVRRNVAAALKLPLVHLGLVRDFWSTFDRYLELERGLGSTFFAIPFKGEPGRTADGPAPRLRASAYGVPDIEASVRSLTAAGSEVGVHGIDAWRDSSRASAEREAVSRVVGASVPGVRMHWLYFDEKAPQRLDEAGFDYDSSVGYNETVGFRAGTLQAFKPLTARRLLELPLHVMDTSLFYPSHLDLAPPAARRMVLPLIEEAERHGGALTVNWHDRSIAPERLWDGFYLDLLGELRRHGPWFPTAAQAVRWFRRRRSIKVDVVRESPDSTYVRASTECTDELPGFTVRVHGRSGAVTDLPLRDTLDVRVAVGRP